ncbi:MAG TPA: hypothetical protein VJ575_01100 [Pseudogulbenkiania sp.]|nr:hypothetical protein [Pseudogulbenkiania sp.]
MMIAIAKPPAARMAPPISKPAKIAKIRLSMITIGFRWKADYNVL